MKRLVKERTEVRLEPWSSEHHAWSNIMSIHHAVLRRRSDRCTLENWVSSDKKRWKQNPPPFVMVNVHLHLIKAEQNVLRLAYSLTGMPRLAIH